MRSVRGRKERSKNTAKKNVIERRENVLSGEKMSGPDTTNHLYPVIYSWHSRK